MELLHRGGGHFRKEVEVREVAAIFINARSSRVLQVLCVEGPPQEHNNSKEANGGGGRRGEREREHTEIT